ncbi:hypothetical protein [Treponema sp.]|uniref:hypothetical protein n=1 Tax=Treponema sp. TaxID=166 RepID=UPI0025F17A57|nr:hypothetical protein [Treponema sp.]MCR5217412.1 hypothetical protein [Treponema sp.]
MACFTVPLAEGLIISAVRHFYLKKSAASDKETVPDSRITFVRDRIPVLQKMLFGGSFLLAIEHVYHGEVVFYPPFLTAMKTFSETKEMLFEMATAGTAMALLTTAVWAAGTAIQALLKKTHFTKINSIEIPEAGV